MSEANSGSPFADVLRQTLELSKQVQAAQEADDEQEDVVVERADGMIRVTAKPDGQIGIALNPMSMRIGSEVLAEEIAAAVNESLATLQERRLSIGNLDLDAVNQQVEELQQQASTQLTNFMDGILRAYDAAGGATEPNKKE